MSARTFRRLSLSLALLVPAGGCTFFAGDPHVLVTSDPPGAEILVDGASTGLTTPALVELGGIFAADHEITVRRTGYEPEERHVTHYTTGETSRWIDGASSDLGLIAFPLFWTIGDFLTPFAVRWQYVPSELFVRLYPIGEAPARAVEPASR